MWQRWNQTLNKFEKSTDDGVTWERLDISETVGYRNVRDYGALGDGVTNDTAAIQDALDDMLINGGRLLFPPGVYCVGVGGTGLVVSQSNNFAFEIIGAGKIMHLQISGEAATTLKWVGSAGGKILSVIAMNGGRIEGITFDCNTVNPAANGLYIESCVGTHFECLGIDNSSEYGFWIRSVAAGVYSCTFNNLHTEETCDGGMLHDADNGSPPVADIAHCTFTNLTLNYKGTTRHALSLKSTDNCWFFGLTIRAVDWHCAELMYLHDKAGTDFGALSNFFFGVDGGTGDVTSGGGGTQRSIKSDVVSPDKNVIFGLNLTNGIPGLITGTHPETLYVMGDSSGFIQSRHFSSPEKLAFSNATQPLHLYSDSSSGQTRMQMWDAATAIGFRLATRVGAGVDIDLLDINGTTGDAKLKGSITLDGSKIVFDSITNADMTGEINATGYNGGVTRFRDLSIKDGKGVEIIKFMNSLVADNGAFLSNGFSLHVGSATRVGRTSVNPTNVINFYPGTLPAGTMAGGLQVYAKDSGAGLIRLYYMDSGGTERGPL